MSQNKVPAKPTYIVSMLTMINFVTKCHNVVSQDLRAACDVQLQRVPLEHRAEFAQKIGRELLEQALVSGKLYTVDSNSHAIVVQTVEVV
jgi:hypothetical protein